MPNTSALFTAAALTAALLATALAPMRARAQSLSANEARGIAKDAYIYGFPLVDSYRIQYAYLGSRPQPFQNLR
jgi:hypothetical protein